MPFAAFGAWRLLLASVVPPASVVATTAVVSLLLLGSLLWLHHSDAGNAGHAYVPARVENGRLLPGHAAD